MTTVDDGVEVLKQFDAAVDGDAEMELGMELDLDPVLAEEGSRRGCCSWAKASIVLPILCGL